MQRHWSFGRIGRRLRVAGPVGVAAVALVPMSAHAHAQPGGAMGFTHSASGGNTVVYEMNAADPLPTSVQFTFDQNAAASSGSNTCTSSDPAFQTNPVQLEPGVAEWTLAPA